MARTSAQPVKALRISQWDRERTAKFFRAMRMFALGSALFLVVAMMVV